MYYEPDEQLTNLSNCHVQVQLPAICLNLWMLQSLQDCMPQLQTPSPFCISQITLLWWKECIEYELTLQLFYSAWSSIYWAHNLLDSPSVHAKVWTTFSSRSQNSVDKPFQEGRRHPQIWNLCCYSPQIKCSKYLCFVSGIGTVNKGTVRLSKCSFFFKKFWFPFLCRGKILPSRPSWPSFTSLHLNRWKVVSGGKHPVSYRCGGLDWHLGCFVFFGYVLDPLMKSIM